MERRCADVEFVSDGSAAEFLDPAGLLILEVIELFLVLLLQGIACRAEGLLEPFRPQSKARERLVCRADHAGAERIDRRAKLLIESLRVVRNVLPENWQRGQKKNDRGKLHGGEGYRKTVVGTRLSAVGPK